MRTRLLFLVLRAGVAVSLLGSKWLARHLAALEKEALWI